MTRRKKTSCRPSWRNFSAISASTLKEDANIFIEEEAGRGGMDAGDLKKGRPKI